MNGYIYYPVTSYHLLLSILLRELKISSNRLILDEGRFDATMINKIIKIGAWDNIHIVRKYDFIKHHIYNFILYRSKYSKLFKLKNFNIIFFTFNNNFCNLFINTIKLNNNVFLCEDGIFPYLGFDIIYSRRVNRANDNFLKRLKRYIKYKVLPSKYVFNPDDVYKILLFNPDWMPKESSKQHKISSVSSNKKAIHRALRELTQLYGYRRQSSIRGSDIIFFDSYIVALGYLSAWKEYEILRNVFKILADRRVYVKLRPYDNKNTQNARIALYQEIQNNTCSKMTIGIAEANYPWEIIFYNNAVELKDVIFMSETFSTSLITPKKFFESNNYVIALNKLFLNANLNLDRFVERINTTYLEQRVFLPRTLPELQHLIITIGNQSLESLWNPSNDNHLTKLM